jgi:hypothetical protein
MTIAARPDVHGAVIARLLSFTEITNVVSTRVSGTYKQDWLDGNTNKPKKSIVLTRAGGPAGKPQLNIMRTRLDTRSYGQNGHECERVWAILDAVICPGQERQVSFIQTVNGVKCRVYDIQREAMPTQLVDPRTNWPYTFCPYLVTWSGIAAL